MNKYSKKRLSLLIKKGRTVESFGRDGKVLKLKESVKRVISRLGNKS